jgi:hypothetical protein
MIGALLSQLEQLWHIPVNLSRRGASWAACWRLATWALRGAGRVRAYAGSCDGAPIRVVTIGRTSHSLQFCEDVVGKLDLVEARGRVSLRRPDGLRDIDADLVAAEIHPRYARAFSEAGWIVVCGWLRWCGDLDQMPVKFPRSVKSDLNKVAAHRYVLQRGGGRQDWRQFWNSMVDPYADTRFKEWAWTPSWILRRVLEQFGALHFVVRDQQRLAGFAALTRAGRAWFPVLGALPDPRLRADGIFAAVYKFTFDWARAENLRYVDLGRSEAFGRDGVGKYKEKWGLRPVPDLMSHRIAIRASHAVRGAFFRQPVRVLADDRLELFVGDSR